MHEPATELGEPIRESALQLVEGCVVQRSAAGLHEIQDRLGLDEVQLPVQISPARELARFG